MTAVLVAGITLLALGLRLYCLDCWGLWYDEVISVDVARGGPEAIFGNRFGWLGNQTPPYYLVLWVLSHLADPTQSSVFVRLPSVVAGTLAVPLLYLLGRDTFGRPTGLLSAALLALSLTALNYSQDARQYSVTLFLTLAAVYSLSRVRLGGGGKWWAGFTTAMVGNMLYSYLTVTVVLPVVALLAAWVLWDRWRLRAGAPVGWPAVIASVVILGPVAAVMALDAARIPSLPFELSRVPIGEFLFTPFGDWLWLLRPGLGGGLNVQIAIYLLPLAVFGFVAGIRKGGNARIAALWIGILILLPEMELVILSSTKVVLPRYIAFVLPYLLLLVSYGVFTLVKLVTSLSPRRLPLLKAVSPAAAVLVLAPFALGAANYYNPETFALKNIRPEFKRAASYLRDVAQPGDMIVVTSEPPHATTVLDFYWNESPPAQVYDALDPAMYNAPSPQRMHVVIGGWPGSATADYLNQENAGFDYSYDMGTVVLSLEGGGKPVLELMEAWVSQFLKTVDSGRLSLALRGSIEQANGKTEQAAETYAQASGTTIYTSIWREHVATAAGFQELGQVDRAWRELLIAKLESSSAAEVHRHLARILESRGLEGLAAQEDRIAAALESTTAAMGRQE